MTEQTIGYVTYDPADTTDDLFFQWDAALELEESKELPQALWAGYDSLRDLAPAAMLAEDPMSEQTARKLYRAQVFLARSFYARARATQQQDGGEYQLQDMSRRYYLEARSIVRPRDWKALL